MFDSCFDKLNDMISGQDYLNWVDPNSPNGVNGVNNGPNDPNDPNDPNGPSNSPNSPNGPNGPNGRMGSYVSSGSYYVLPPNHPTLPSISSNRAMQLLFDSETPAKPQKIPAKVSMGAGIERSCRCPASCTSPRGMDASAASGRRTCTWRRGRS